jgi:hypothetical protein
MVNRWTRLKVRNDRRRALYQVSASLCMSARQLRKVRPSYVESQGHSLTVAAGRRPAQLVTAAASAARPAVHFDRRVAALPLAADCAGGGSADPGCASGPAASGRPPAVASPPVARRPADRRHPAASAAGPAAASVAAGRAAGGPANV